MNSEMVPFDRFKNVYLQHNFYLLKKKNPSINPTNMVFNELKINYSLKNIPTPNKHYAVQNELYIVPKWKVKIVAEKDTSNSLRASSRGGDIITPNLLESWSVGTTRS